MNWLKQEFVRPVYRLYVYELSYQGRTSMFCFENRQRGWILQVNVARGVSNFLAIEWWCYECGAVSVFMRLWMLITEIIVKLKN